LLLIVERNSYALAQIGPNFVTLREPLELPSGDAEIVMLIDGHEQHRWPVTLEHGAVPFELDVATADR